MAKKKQKAEMTMLSSDMYVKYVLSFIAVLMVAILGAMILMIMENNYKVEGMIQSYYSQGLRLPNLKVE